MSHANTLGATRPNTTTSPTTTDGIATETKWIQEATLVKRLRRKLASMDLALRRNRQGSADRAKYGEWTAIDPKSRAIIWHNVLLCEMARDLGVLAPDERIEEPPRLRKHYVARHVVSIVDGVKVHSDERLTRDLTTVEAARKAAERFGGDDIAVVSYAPDPGHAREDREGGHDTI